MRTVAEIIAASNAITDYTYMNTLLLADHGIDLDKVLMVSEAEVDETGMLMGTGALNGNWDDFSDFTLATKQDENIREFVANTNFRIMADILNKFDVTKAELREAGLYSTHEETLARLMAEDEEDQFAA